MTGVYRERTLVFVAVLLAVALMLSAQSAAAETEIGSPGSGAGQTNDPRGIAVDEAEDLLYVADRGNNRIDVFDVSSGDFIRAFGWGVATGANELQVCTTTCLSGIVGSGSGQLKEIQGIAVDNYSASPGAVYVFDAGNRRIQRFTSTGEFVWAAGDGVNVTTGGDLCTKASGDTCGPGTGGNAAGQLNVPEGDTIDVGPGGAVYIGDRILASGVQKTRVQTWSPEGAYLGLLGGKFLEVAGGAGNTTALVVDSEGNVYVGTTNGFGSGAVRKYDASGTELLVFNPSFNINTLAIGSEGHVFVGDNSVHEDEVNSAIYEYDPSGNLQRVIYGPLKNKTQGLAVYPNPNGDVFAAEFGSSRIFDIDLPPSGPLVYPKLTTLLASSIGNTKATLHGKVNPEGEATTYYFEYITDADYQAAGGAFGAGTLKTQGLGPLPADFTLHPVQTELNDLAAETKYHWRIAVSSAATGSGSNFGPSSTFTTKQSLEFGDIWPSDVGITTATLSVEVNPLGIPATARFEYVELPEFEASGWLNAKVVPVGEEIDLGEGEEMVDASVHVDDLEPGTAYRFRAIATNRCKPAPAPLCAFIEPEATFTTFLADRLEDCPNHPFRVGWPGVEPGPGQQLPDCRAYEMVSPVNKSDANVEAGFAIPSGYRANMDRAALDGNSVTYSSYKAFNGAISAPYTNQYLARRDPENGWQSEAISPKREEPALMTFLTATLDRQYKEFSDDLCNGWVVQDAKPILSPGGIEGYPGLYRRDLCDPGDGSYEALTTVEPPNLPPRKFIPEIQGTSADGSVAIFGVNDNLTSDAPPQPLVCVEEPSPSAEGCDTRLYEARDGQLEFVCILPDGSPHTGSCGAGSANSPIAGGSERTGSLSNAISLDGSRIFWSTSASVSALGSLYARINGTETIEISDAPTYFWKAAADGSKVLYSVGQQLYVFDVASETETPVAGSVFGVAGASEDLSRIYFASGEVLTGSQQNSIGATADAGEGNLYLYEPESDPEMTFVAALSVPELVGTKSSLVAKSPARRLSRVTPDGQHIAFMSQSSLTGYDNTDVVSKEPDFEVFLYDATSEQLLCPSCNPSGARPLGRKLDLKLFEEWTASRIPVFISQLYGQRVLSNDGSRLYFNSFDALSVNDVNEQEDVYQWEAAGTGSCKESSPTYHGVAGGCIDLISSGRSSHGSELVDISVDGRDVFFKTFESLVPQDSRLLDIYDARVEGGFLYPPSPPSGPNCSDQTPCQSPTSPPVNSAPATRSSGAGNPKWPKPCPKGKRKVKRQGKLVCVKKKQSKKHRKSNRGGRSR